MPRELCYVFKRELLYIPFFGWGIALLDMILIDRRTGAPVVPIPGTLAPDELGDRVETWNESEMQRISPHAYAAQGEASHA